MKKIKILIVEDDLKQSELLAIMIKRFFARFDISGKNEDFNNGQSFGYSDNLSIDFATDCKEASIKIQSFNYSLITLDGSLADGDHGRDLLKLMNFDEIKRTIIISGDLKFIEECRENNMLCLQKPIPINTLEEFLFEINRSLDLCSP